METTHQWQNNGRDRTRIETKAYGIVNKNMWTQNWTHEVLPDRMCWCKDHSTIKFKEDPTLNSKSSFHVCSSMFSFSQLRTQQMPKHAWVRWSQSGSNKTLALLNISGKANILTLNWCMYYLWSSTISVAPLN